MKNLSVVAKIFITLVLILGGALTVWQLTGLDAHDWQLLLAACILASFLQTLKIEGSTYRTSYNLSWVVYGFVLILMGPAAATLVILVAHLVEWAWHRYPWYIQTFNIASFAITITASGLTYRLISPSQEPVSLFSSLAILGAAALFTIINHLLVGLAIKFARGQSLTDSGVLDPLSLALDFGLLCLGAAGAIIWLVNPYAVILVALLALLLQNVLRVPALKRQSDTDPKVGLFNSRYFTRMVDQELDRANRFNRPLTLVMADMDHLRQVNNDYGHLAGDVVLQSVAKILQKSAREYDTVARFGGEEFAILMPETQPIQAFSLIEAMRAAIEESEVTVATSVTPIKVTMSFGLAGRIDQDLKRDQLIHMADLAVYDAKQEGRNCTNIYGGQETSIVSSPPAEVAVEKVANEKEPVRNPAPVTDEINRDNGRAKQPEPAAIKSGTDRPVTTVKPPRPGQINLYIGALAATALSLSLFLIQSNWEVNWIGLAAFTLLVALVEGLAVEIYVKETSVSTSAAPLLAGVLLFGPIAAVILGLTVALSAFFRQRSQFDRLIFNASNHVMGGLLAAGIVIISGRQFLEWSMPVQMVISLIAISFLYLSTTILVSGAVCLNTGQSLKSVWKERFRWLAPYYLALGMMAYVLVFSYDTAGLLGIVVVMVPLMLLRFSQKQYVDHTKAVVNKLRATNVQLTQQADEISLLNEELLVALAKATDMRDPYVMEHSLNVSRYAKLIAQELGLSKKRVEMVRKAGLLHDIGKLSIPDAILFKPGRLTDEEYAVIQAHSLTGAQLIHDCHSLQGLIPIIQHHHEHYDGSGYPHGLAGEEIPLEARILCVADALEAMSSDRPYRKARTPQGTVEEMKKFAGSQFDPQVVEAFIRVIQKEGESVIVNSARDVQARNKKQGFYDIKNERVSRKEDYRLNKPALATG